MTEPSYRRRVRKPGLPRCSRPRLVATSPCASSARPPTAPGARAAPDRLLRRGRAPRLAHGRPAGRRRGDAGSSGTPRPPRRVGGRRYDDGTWISPWRTPGFDLTELIASWDAGTPGNSWIEVQVRGRTGERAPSSWDVARPLGRRRHASFRRTSCPGPGRRPRPRRRRHLAGDRRRARRLAAPGHPAPRQRRSQPPPVDAVGAIASRLPDVADVATSDPGPRRSGTCCGCRATRRWCTAATTRSRTAAARPGAHRRRPRWSSATTTRCRRPGRTPGSRRDYPDPWVDHAARMTYDAALRRHRQLAVQHRLRRDPDRRRLRHPAAQSPRGRALHRRRHPAGRVDLVRRRRARRRPDLVDATATCW